MQASPRLTQDRRQAGFTLIELMVAMVVGMVIVLALMTVTTNFEKSKRQAQGNAVMGQNIGYISYDLDRQLRSAGSGFLSGARDPSMATDPAAPDLTAYRRALGCTLNVSRGGTRVLPMTAAAPDPFGSVPQSVRMIPVLIHAGIGAGSSDVLAIMSGSSGIGETPIGVRANGVTSSQIDLLSSVGIKANDLLMLIETGQPCLMTQVATGYVSSGTNTAVTLGGTYYAATSGSASLTGYGSGLGAGNPANYPGGSVSSVLLFGNGANNLPQMHLFGVNTLHELRAYDLLNADGSGAAYTAAENVQDLRALYGLDTDFNGTVDAWVQPTGNFAASALTAGTDVAQNRLMQIRAVRIALLVHSDRIEATKDGRVTANSIKAFEDLGPALTTTISISAADRQRHYKIVDFTIPLRNSLQMPVINAAFPNTPISQIVP